MIEKDNVIYYSSTETAKICGKTRQTVNLWDNYSKRNQERNIERFIPEPIRINNRRYWTKEQVEEIKKFSDNLKRGDLAGFSRERWGKRGQEIQKRIDEKWASMTTDEKMWATRHKKRLL